MSKNLLNFIVTIVLAGLLGLVLPWWAVMLAGLTTGMFIPLKKAAVFFIPFGAVLVLWTVYAFTLSSANDFILAKKIAELLMLDGNPFLLVLVSGIIGGIAAGLSGVLGKQIISVFPSR